MNNRHTHAQISVLPWIIAGWFPWKYVFNHWQRLLAVSSASTQVPSWNSLEKEKDTKDHHDEFDWFTSDHDRCSRDFLRSAQHNSRLRREIADICRILVECYWDISSRRIDKLVEARLDKEDDQTTFFPLLLRWEIHRIEIDLLVEWAMRCSRHWFPDWTEDRWIPTSRETHPGQCHQTRDSPRHCCSSEVFHKGQVMQLLTKLCHTRWSVHQGEFSRWKTSVLEGNSLEPEQHWLSWFSSMIVSRLVLNGNVWDRSRSFVSCSMSPFEQLWHPWEEKNRREETEREKDLNSSSTWKMNDMNMRAKVDRWAQLLKELSLIDHHWFVFDCLVSSRWWLSIQCAPSWISFGTSAKCNCTWVPILVWFSLLSHFKASSSSRTTILFGLYFVDVEVWVDLHSLVYRSLCLAARTSLSCCFSFSD